MEKILCIEDDLSMQTLVCASIKDYEVICAKTLKEAEVLLGQMDFSALLVDIQLPDGDGLRFLTQLTQNEKYSHTPILILSGHSDISNKVMAFSFGADDFVTKPFDPVELNVRVTAKIRKRHAAEEKARKRRLKDLLIDFDRQKVFQVLNGKEIDLECTSIELKLLALLTKRLEQVYSRDQIMRQVWAETSISDRTVDSHIAHLRQKIEGTQIQIETAKSFGYLASIKA